MAKKSVRIGLLGVAMHLLSGTSAAAGGEYANRYDRQRAEVLEARAADWRNGGIVYQVIVDRFAPPADLDGKAHLYPAPKRLRAWSDDPEPGTFLPEAQVWSHEIDFWGGDLASLRERLDYVADLGADVLYLNPIHQAYTNHKYDAEDYFAVSKEYGTREELERLADAVHEKGMRLVLDGVFNHVGRRSQWFQEALGDPQSPYRQWFVFGDTFGHGYRAWARAANLPELNLENPEVRARIFGDADSVVRSYLEDGVDGWRLDVGYELGFKYLEELTEAAHATKPGSLVIGENWVYPEEWSPALDAVLNLYDRQVIQYLVRGRITGAHAGRMFDRMIEDTGLDHVLKSWIILDNHDLPRLKTYLPEEWQRRIAQVLQFTLPGCPCVYYGVEVGMEGGEDPAQRGPMRWDLVGEDNPDFRWLRRLIRMRKENRALRIGDFRLLDAQRILAFMRRTDRVAETTVILANAEAHTVDDVVPLRDSKLMQWQWLADELSEVKAVIQCGTLAVSMPPRTIWVLRPEIRDSGEEYSPYKRVQ